MVLKRAGVAIRFESLRYSGTIFTWYAVLSEELMDFAVLLSTSAHASYRPPVPPNFSSKVLLREALAW